LSLLFAWSKERGEVKDNYRGNDPARDEHGLWDDRQFSRSTDRGHGEHYSRRADMSKQTIAAVKDFEAEVNRRKTKNVKPS